jgi:hypothetical protein
MRQKLQHTTIVILRQRFLLQRLTQRAQHHIMPARGQGIGRLLAGGDIDPGRNLLAPADCARQ